MVLDADSVLWLKDLDIEDKNIVGHEYAKLGELTRNGIEVLPIIIVTPFAFEIFKKENNLTLQIKHLLGTINFERHDSVSQVTSFIHRIITRSEISKNIYTKLFDYYDLLEYPRVSLTALYFKDRKQISQKTWNDTSGEAVLIEKVRLAWANLFTVENLHTHSIDHNNHQAFSVCLIIKPQLKFEFTGEVRTFGQNKNEFELEAHNYIKYVYNRYTKKITRGHVTAEKHKNILDVSEIKDLFSYAHKLQKLFYFPHILFWGKYKGKFIATGVNQGIELVKPGTFTEFVQSETVNPGITIGKLKIVDKNYKSGNIENDEIVVVKNLDKKMLSALRKAKGLIIESNVNADVLHLLKGVGIPAIITGKNIGNYYVSGNVVSLNASTGEIKRGSMLVS